MQWSSSGWKLEYDGLGGSRWQDRRSVLRGLATTGPSRMVISLGANDAIRLALMGYFLQPGIPAEQNLIVQ